MPYPEVSGFPRQGVTPRYLHHRLLQRLSVKNSILLLKPSLLAVDQSSLGRCMRSRISRAISAVVAS